MKKPDKSAWLQNVVGVVPMAGSAKRLGSLQCSKEIHPVESSDSAGTDRQAGVVCEHILMQMQRAGINRIYITLRDGKWDIPACLGDGSRLGLHLAYLMMGLPHGTPYSIDQAYPFMHENIVALGFADTLFTEQDVFSRLLVYLGTVDADVVLGLFPTERPEKTDMVDLAADGTVKNIVVKPTHTDLTYSWCIAVWTPVFSRFMHKFLAQHQHVATNRPELFVGNVIQAAIDSGLRVCAIPVSQQPFLDIGTPEDLQRLGSYISDSQ
jgi:glucose-1-phosphate thymidylyltransferase